MPAQPEHAETSGSSAASASTCAVGSPSRGGVCARAAAVACAGTRAVRPSRTSPSSSSPGPSAAKPVASSSGCCSSSVSESRRAAMAPVAARPCRFAGSIGATGPDDRDRHGPFGQPPPSRPRAARDRSRLCRSACLPPRAGSRPRRLPRRSRPAIRTRQPAGNFGTACVLLEPGYTPGESVMSAAILNWWYTLRMMLQTNRIATAALEESWLQVRSKAPILSASERTEYLRVNVGLGGATACR